jgi:hypothetical protein
MLADITNGSTNSLALIKSLALWQQGLVTDFPNRITIDGTNLLIAFKTTAR